MRLNHADCTAEVPQTCSVNPQREGSYSLRLESERKHLILLLLWRTGLRMALHSIELEDVEFAFDLSHRIEIAHIGK